jgi:ABC-type dipeptide/oligopeptide/nickel transport system ATPase component
MIAMAIACEPSILIADEPTTAIDVTTQAQILDLLLELQNKTNMAIVLITHNLGVVARMADDVAVMYAGEIVEKGNTDDIFYRASHPYTLGLQGAMPDMFVTPVGCAYYARCPYAMRLCAENYPQKFSLNPNHHANCWLHHESASLEIAPQLFRGATP